MHSRTAQQLSFRQRSCRKYEILGPPNNNRKPLLIIYICTRKSLEEGEGIRPESDQESQTNHERREERPQRHSMSLSPTWWFLCLMG